MTITKAQIKEVLTTIMEDELLLHNCRSELITFFATYHAIVGNPPALNDPLYLEIYESVKSKHAQS